MPCVFRVVKKTLKKQKYETNQKILMMKKYLTTLAAMALAIGGAVVFAGCDAGAKLEGDASTGKGGTEMTEEEINKAEEAKGGGEPAPEDEEKK